jgi:membrane associated rhomboid family serine protease
MALPSVETMMLLSAIVVAAVTWYILTPAERDRVRRACVRRVAQVMSVLKVVARAFRRERSEVLEDALRQRSWPLVTLSIATLNIAVHAWSHFDPAAPVADILGNVAARTTSGEWWRLLSAIVVHPNLLHLVVNTIALVQVGLVLERLTGSLTFVAVYAVSGVFAGLYTLSGFEATPAMGASGAVFGIYGLLIATWMWGALQRSETTLRLGTVKAFAPVAALFTLVHLTSPTMAGEAEWLGLVTGFTCGVLMARPVRIHAPPVRRVATVAAAAAYLAIVAAVPLRGMTDPRPLLATVVVVEQQTAAAYDAAVEEFSRGRMDRKDLVQVIEGKILPALQSARLELQHVDRAPRDLVPHVRAAEIYTIRRIESWRIRADALRTGYSRRLRDAEAVQRSALERLRSIPPGA